MKTIQLFALVGTLSVVVVFQPTKLPAFATDRPHAEISHYVVVGAFAVPRNASKFKKYVSQRLHVQAQQDFNPNRNLYYVFVLRTTDLEVAVTEAKRLRSEEDFPDAWVFHGLLGHDAAATTPGQDINPVTQQHLEETPVNPNDVTPVSTPETTPSAPATKTSDPDSAASKSETSNKVVDAAGAKYFFRIYNASNYDSLLGDVDVIDAENSRKLGSYKANRPVKVNAGSVKSGNVTLVAHAFGFRKLQRDLNINQPAADDIEQREDGAVVVPFEMVRLQKGDISVMYNVFFFKDAAIMRPESKYEVNSLLAMMQDNPKYKIRIHGHTNGNSHGKILEMAKDTDNYFTLSGATEGFGSAKKLSEERATVIRNYLVKNGIAAERLEVKSWGGKRPIYDRHSNRAGENVRVEIEILEN